MAMALFKNFLDSLKLTEEDDEELDDEYDEYLVQQQEKERRKQEQKQQKQEQKDAQRRARKDDSYTGREYAFSSSHERSSQQERSSQHEREKPARTNVSKVVPLNRKAGFEVRIMKPEKFENSQEICDILLSNRAVVINLEGYDVELAQRIMDFVSGAVYALDGNLQPISDYIFIIAPGNIDISGNTLDMMQQDGFEIPTFSKNF